MDSDAASPLRTGGEGAPLLALKVTPRASRNAVAGLEREPGGRARLKVAVTAPPDGGKANAAVLKYLSKLWKIPKSSLTIAAGGSSRLKEVAIAGDVERVAVWISAYMKKAETVDMKKEERDE